jgi:hypothetical protein
MKTTKNYINSINFYWTDENYIHFKFWDLRKSYNFTKEFCEKYPVFAEEFWKYFDYEESIFKNPREIVLYVYNYKIPVYFYFNFSDTPCYSKRDAIRYLTREYMGQNKDKLYTYTWPWKYQWLDTISTANF